MKKLSVFGLALALVLSLALVGTSLAQDDDTTNTETAWLGISLADSDNGVVVMRVVTDSPAETGGLQIGDVITSFDGEDVESADAFVALVQDATPGDTVSIEVLRNDTARTLDIELGTQTTTKTRSSLAEDLDSVSMAEMLLHVSLTPVDGGYQVGAIGGRSTNDLQDGDIVTAINGQPVDEFDWTTTAESLMESDNPALIVSFERDGEAQELELSFSGGRQGGMMIPFGFDEDLEQFHNAPGGQRGRGSSNMGPRSDNRPDSTDSDSSGITSSSLNLESSPA